MRSKEMPIVRNMLILIVCFVIDSTISYFLPYNLTKTGVSIVPNIGLLMFVLLSMTLLDTASRFFFAAIAGFYYTMAYGSGLLIYVLFYLGIVFFRTYIYHTDIKLTFPEFLLVGFLAIVLKEVGVYWLMSITKTTRLGILNFTLLRFLPTVIANFVVSPLVFYVFSLFNIKVEINPFDQELL